MEKYPIALNDVTDFHCKISSDLKHKGNLVSLQVQTALFGIGENSKQSGMSFGKKTAQKLNPIEKPPLTVVVTVLMIYWEVIPSMIYMVLIPMWDMFKALFTGTAVADLTTSSSRPAGKISSSSNNISTIRSASHMKTTNKSRPGKKKSIRGI